MGHHLQNPWRGPGLDGAELLAEHGSHTTASGAAGVAALLAGMNLPPEARVLAILSEGPEDG